MAGNSLFENLELGALDLAADTHRWETYATVISVHQTAERHLGSLNANVVRLQRRALGRS